MHRLFVAIDLPEKIKLAIHSLRCPISGAKWVAEEQLHLTLRFIGDADDDLLNRIATRLSCITAAPFSLAMMGVGCFPPKRDPKVLWVGVAKNEALLKVQYAVEKALLTCGLEPEIRSFSPHITIARLKQTSAVLLAPFLQKNNCFSTPFFPVTEFILYSSTLALQGAIHRQEALFPLIG
ncbi:MAG: RNA 2',3'-cyclic phosphodiesterase [Geobacteraceae bacterium]|nr:RNA 2',3'-cyclic phosphodiesterase [Geobacteraceae bacterium]